MEAHPSSFAPACPLRLFSGWTFGWGVLMNKREEAPAILLQGPGLKKLVRVLYFCSCWHTARGLAVLFYEKIRRTRRVASEIRLSARELPW